MLMTAIDDLEEKMTKLVRAKKKTEVFDDKPVL